VIIDSADVYSDPDSVHLSPLKPINLITGLTSGAHFIIPAAYLSENFKIKYGLGHLKIDSAALTIKAANKTIRYGEALPAFSSEITGYKLGDDSATVFSSATTYTLLNSANQVVSPANIQGGTYRIVPSIQLKSPANYKLVITYGTLTVNGATLIVKADDKVIFKGDPLPTNYTATYTGFINNDQNTIVSGPVFTLTPAKPVNAGIYPITPSKLILQNPGSYVISYEAGSLYINPSGSGVKNVKPKLECVDTVSDNTSPYRYVAHYSYTNPNKSPVFVPRGPENMLTSPEPYGGMQPQLFEVGTKYFDIYFNGKKMTWTLITYNGNQKSSSTQDASSSSAKCSSHYTTSVITARKAGGVQTGGTVAQELTSMGKFAVYPNPVSDKVIISFRDPNIQQKDITLWDLPGRMQHIKHFSKISSNSASLDLSNLVTGVYILRVRINNENKTTVIIKL
jgi:hypothetical protein